MSDDAGKKTPGARKKERLERQAQALRENLLKRKTQVRERAAEEAAENDDQMKKSE